MILAMVSLRKISYLRTSLRYDPESFVNLSRSSVRFLNPSRAARIVVEFAPSSQVWAMINSAMAFLQEGFKPVDFGSTRETAPPAIELRRNKTKSAWCSTSVQAAKSRNDILGPDAAQR